MTAVAPVAYVDGLWQDHGMKSNYAAVIFVFLIVAATLATGIAGISLSSPQPSTSTTAVVTGFAVVGYRQPAQIVLFRTRNGISGEGNAFADGISCRKGDIIPVLQTGITLALAPGACRKR
jgi:hypothetical protein